MRDMNGRELLYRTRLCTRHRSLRYRLGPLEPFRDIPYSVSPILKCMRLTVHFPCIDIMLATSSPHLESQALLPGSLKMLMSHLRNDISSHRPFSPKTTHLSPYQPERTGGVLTTIRDAVTDSGMTQNPLVETSSYANLCRLLAKPLAMFWISGASITRG